MAVLAALALPLSALAEGPKYTYVGLDYEWTDVKYAAEPDEDSIQGFSLESSLGIISWLHLTGEYFTGEADNSNQDLDGFKFGVGFNFALPFAEDVDFVSRLHYVDAELENISEEGFAIDLGIRAQVSDRAEVHLAWDYTELDSVDNRQIVVGLVFHIANWFAVRTSGSVFDDDTGFDIGVRFTFGDNLVSF